ncbi:MAG TPA: class I SAM-dependent methyltransferase [Sphingomicrobium sp.]|jgi:ubiquinone/menaquinone biosynthesis C-methylase UbiE|nr:class I SAM-dependent methyltransferase [Sphingomicrobium sp.]
MKDQELRFSGSVPASYDRLMVPLIFRPYAEELARRAAGLGPARVLETAAGTGAVTQALHAALPNAEIVATDLNQPMLDVAAERLRADNVRFLAADAQDLPFDKGSFDLVVCQFGAMFFPDRVRAHTEARRVLRDGGHYLLAIWDRIERNVLTDVSQQTLIELFPEDPPLFMREGPFSYSDPSAIERDLHAAGFATVEIETVEKPSRASSAHDAAAALCYGTPMGVEIQDRGPGSLERVFDAVERKFQAFERNGEIEAPMSAHIVKAS